MREFSTVFLQPERGSGSDLRSRGRSALTSEPDAMNHFAALVALVGQPRNIGGIGRDRVGPELSQPPGLAFVWTAAWAEQNGARPIGAITAARHPLEQRHGTSKQPRQSVAAIAAIVRGHAGHAYDATKSSGIDRTRR